MNIEQIIQQLIQTDVRFEIIMRALVGVLSSKKNADGTPFLTVEEVNTASAAIQTAIVEEQKKAASAIVTPTAEEVAAVATPAATPNA